MIENCLIAITNKPMILKTILKRKNSIRMFLK